MLRWIYNNRVINLSVVIAYSIPDLTINAFSSPLGPFDPKRNVSVLVEAFWFHKNYRKELLFDLSNLSSGERSE